MTTKTKREFMCIKCGYQQRSDNGESSCPECGGEFLPHNLAHQIILHEVARLETMDVTQLEGY